MTIFFATLTPMLTLFLCIAIGFVMAKAKILPDSSGKTLARLETWILCPALSFITMVRYCTVDMLSINAVNLVMGTVTVVFSMIIAIVLARLFVKEGGPERGVYAYALAFANSSYVGDPLVMTLFGDAVLAYYKIFCLPICLVIYTWGISALTPKAEGKASVLKGLLNAPTIAMLVGVAMGLTGMYRYMPQFLISSLDSFKACVGPVAMLLAGITIARYDFLGMLKKKKVYLATFLRLVVIPAVLILALFGIKTLANQIFSLTIGNDVLFLCFFATAAALGLNTVIFPEAYNGNPETGASMAMVSHTLCVITIPLIYAAMIAIFGSPFEM